MSKIDPWALLRAREEVTISEAARIVSGVPHGRQYPQMRPDWTQELRDEKGNLDATYRELVASIGELGVTVRKVPIAKQGRSIVSTGLGDMWAPSTRVVAPPATKDEYGPVKLAALKAWSDARGLRPEFFYPVDGNSGGKAFSTTERENLLGLIAVLAEAAGLDLRTETKGHAEGKTIAGWASRRSLRVTAETVAKKLVEGRTFIHPIGPERNSN